MIRATPSWAPGRCRVMVQGPEVESILWWEFSGESLPAGPPPNWDGVAVALVCLAMASGEDLHIAGAMSKEQLAGLEEYQDAWTLLRPDLFKRVTLSADREVAGAHQFVHPNATFAFSGGVDATFQMLAHRRGILGHRSASVVRAVLVHGLDIPLEMSAAFDVAAQGAARMLSGWGVPLARVRTNWRDFCPDWEMCFGSGVAAVLHLFAGDTDAGYLAADAPYGTEVLTFGSNSVTNRMLGGAFRIESSGFGYTRTQKCMHLLTEPSVLGDLRVCWEAPATGKNCGRCEKCTRTKLNFAACGEYDIPALGPLDVADIEGMVFGSPAQLAYLDDIISHGSHLSQEMLSAVKKTRDRSRREMQGRSMRKMLREMAPPQLLSGYRRARAMGSRRMVTRGFPR